MPNNGRGESSRIAQALQMHTTSVSQVLSGKKDLTLEQAARLTKHWGLNQLEAEYFIGLVELERSGAPELVSIMKLRLKRLKAESKDLSNVVNRDRDLSDSERGIFYSSWLYSAVRLLCDIPEYGNLDQIATKLSIPLSLCTEIIDFLLSCGLIIREKNRFKLGSQRTFIGAKAPIVVRHHANWRLKAIEFLEKMDKERDLAFTAPMTISLRDADKVRAILVEAVDKILKINSNSPSEELHFLTIDWHKL